MREKIKQKIALAIKPYDYFSMRTINSYSLGRKSRGDWELIIFFSNRTKAKQIKHVKMPIGTDKTFREEIEATMEEIMAKNNSMTLLDDTEPTNNNKPTEEGW